MSCVSKHMKLSVSYTNTSVAVICIMNIWHKNLKKNGRNQKKVDKDNDEKDLVHGINLFNYVFLY